MTPSKSELDEVQSLTDNHFDRSTKSLIIYTSGTTGPPKVLYTVYLSQCK